MGYNGMTGRQWTRGEVAKLAQLYLDNMSNKEMAIEMNRSVSSIKYQVYKAGISGPKGRATCESLIRRAAAYG